MKKFNKALSVLLASSTLASACPMQQKASALTPAEAAVIGIFGAGALAGGVAAVCLGVQNANIKNELKKEKEAKKDNPAGQSSELTRSQLAEAMRELATVKAQLENAKKEQESSNRVLQDTLDRSKQYEEEKKQLQGKLDEERKKSQQKDLELSQEKESEKKNEKKHTRELDKSKQEIAQLEEQTKTLSKERDKLQEKYDDLMLYSLACLYLDIAAKHPGLQKQLAKLQPFKYNTMSGKHTPNESITPKDLVAIIKLVREHGGNANFYNYYRDKVGFRKVEGDQDKDTGNLTGIIWENVAVMFAALKQHFDSVSKISDGVVMSQSEYLSELINISEIKAANNKERCREAIDTAVKSLDANPGLFSRIFG